MTTVAGVGMLIEPSAKEPGKIQIGMVAHVLGVTLVVTREEAINIAAGILKVVADMDGASGQQG